MGLLGNIGRGWDIGSGKLGPLGGLLGAVGGGLTGLFGGPGKRGDIKMRGEWEDTFTPMKQGDDEKRRRALQILLGQYGNW